MLITGDNLLLLFSDNVKSAYRIILLYIIIVVYGVAAVLGLMLLLCYNYFADYLIWKTKEQQ